ncbi:MAG: serine/threonine-protein kinase [Candidatus Aminicenantales bacterium]
MKCSKCQLENPETSLFCASCGEKLDAAKDLSLFKTETLQTPLKELTTGSTFAGRYKIIEELGKGGMGKVYKVLDTKINEKVALKLIKPEIASDRDTIERFSNELKLARKIRHKNVCGMFDIGEAEGAHYITMEYISGEDLKSFLHRVGRLPIGKAVSISRQVCEGLDEVHRLGVVHRDLKPSNVMIDKDGNARIMDFGIARSLTGKGITGAGVMIGTPEYMSPEQVSRAKRSISDLISIRWVSYSTRWSQDGFPLRATHRSQSASNTRARCRAIRRKSTPSFPLNSADSFSSAWKKTKRKGTGARRTFIPIWPG